MNVLFVCSRNKWRSLTAETIFRSNQGHSFKSAGTESGARVKVNEGMIKWADLIFVMEKRHRERLQSRFADIMNGKKLIILNIEDNYRFMDDDLIDILKSSVDPYL